jgi:orotidine-5'-phosphate decarboxylase
MRFIEKLENAIKKNHSLLCIGLDPDIDKIPKHLHKDSDPVFEFCKQIIDETAHLVCAYKPQIAFFSSLGVEGFSALSKTVRYIKTNYEDIPVILDAKRGDIGTTSEKYVEEAFTVLNADAVTVNPYMGRDSLEPFLEKRDKGIIVLVRTTNPGASDFQDVLTVDGQPFYLYVARKVKDWHRLYNNCVMVVGSTWPDELQKIRQLDPHIFFLVPGVGAQGGNLKKTLEFGLRTDKSGVVISVSRSILFAGDKDDFAKKAGEEALKYKEEINKIRATLFE